MSFLEISFICSSSRTADASDVAAVVCVAVVIASVVVAAAVVILVDTSAAVVGCVYSVDTVKVVVAFADEVALEESLLLAPHPVIDAASNALSIVAVIIFLFIVITPLILFESNVIIEKS